ncbi:sensor histidine kinase [Gordonia rhizosphera]|uniref:histidine kinase n=1 Tax=Gordonia rhizosphera NBRC 16068 TaxID=1108045 RepID=K6W091_9ACTN|nr:ATP-binding protein [Gordonia rhizosphera]GAB92580.1 putative two-component histidine kinase [Gordonia rhizosphera NBRC 16068]
MTAATATFAGPAGPDAQLDQHAGRRILQQFSLFVAIGYVAYGLMCIPFIIESLPVMNTWWTVSALLLIFGPGIAMGPLAVRADIRRLRMMAGATAIGYALAVGLWWFGWNGGLIYGGPGIWFTQFPGLAAVAAALAVRPLYAFFYLAVVILASTVCGHAIRPDWLNNNPVADYAWAFAFSMIFVAAAVMTTRTAGILDATRARALETTAEAAAAEARAAERSRFDSLTHDAVMATLLLAARHGASPELAQNARAALAAIDKAADGERRSAVASPDAIAEVRAAVVLVDPTQTIDVAEVDPTTRYPGSVVTAVAAATAEAVRNSRRHTGPQADCAVTVSAGEERMCIEIRDDGVGFDTNREPTTRLGIAVSIRGRMQKLDGGFAQIESSPGGGTRVRLGWDR